MAFIQLLVSLWPFLKEMFVGEKIKDKDASKESASGKEKKSQFASNVARWIVDRMQNSRRFATTVLVVLMLSLFVNYKVISKLIVLAPRSDETAEPHQPTATEQKELPTVPRPASNDRDALYEQTVRELKSLYGETRS